MVNEIISGISLAIYNEFGNAYTIYTENAPQGLKEPCFFIFPLKPTYNRFLNNRYLLSLPICIQYFPSAAFGKKSECNTVFETLSDLLDVIVTVNNGSVRGKDISYEYQDEVMSVFVTYDSFLLKANDIDQMNDLTQNQTAKEG